MTESLKVRLVGAERDRMQSKKETESVAAYVAYLKGRSLLREGTERSVHMARQQFELAIKAVGRGETFLSPAVSKYVMEGYIHRVGGLGSSLERLTARQREVLQLVAEGHSAKEIARLLHISPRTAEFHKARLMQALGAESTAALIQYALRHGLAPG